MEVPSFVAYECVHSIEVPRSARALIAEVPSFARRFIAESYPALSKCLQRRGTYFWESIYNIEVASFVICMFILQRYLVV